MKIGFTGTREGMTPEQTKSVLDALSDIEYRSGEIDEVHHGDCVGADDMMHGFANARGVRIIVHPPDIQTYRAWNTGDLHFPDAPYLERNRNIVDSTDLLVATPKEMTEQAKGGTWYTVRYARSKGRRIYIVWPDGSVVTEGAHSDANVDPTQRALRPKSS